MRLIVNDLYIIATCLQFSLTQKGLLWKYHEFILICGLS